MTTTIAFKIPEQHANDLLKSIRELEDLPQPTGDFLRGIKTKVAFNKNGKAINIALTYGKITDKHPIYEYEINMIISGDSVIQHGVYTGPEDFAGLGEIGLLSTAVLDKDPAGSKWATEKAAGDFFA